MFYKLESDKVVPCSFPEWIHFLASKEESELLIAKDELTDSEGRQVVVETWFTGINLPGAMLGRAAFTSFVKGGHLDRYVSFSTSREGALISHREILDLIVNSKTIDTYGK